MQKQIEKVTEAVIGCQGFFREDGYFWVHRELKPYQEDTTQPTKMLFTVVGLKRGKILISPDHFQVSTFPSRHTRFFPVLPKK